MLYHYSMDLLLEIEQYLKGELPYKTGVGLYEKLGNSSALKTLFRTEDSYSRKKLKAELQKIIESRKPSLTYEQAKNKCEEAITSGNSKVMTGALQDLYKSDYVSYSPSKKKGSINVEKLPGHLKTEYYKQISYIREISATNAKLLLMPTDEERHVAAKRIVELAEQRKAILKRIDSFLETGQDPLVSAAPNHSALPEMEVSWLQAQYELRLLRSQRTKLKDKPARLADYESVCERIKTLEGIVKKG